MMSSYLKLQSLSDVQILCIYLKQIHHLFLSVSTNYFVCFLGQVDPFVAAFMVLVIQFSAHSLIACCCIL